MSTPNYKSLFYKTLKYLGITFASILCLMFVTPFIFSEKIKEEIKKYLKLHEDKKVSLSTEQIEKLTGELKTE